jgi:predicted DNA-binding protein
MYSLYIVKRTQIYLDETQDELLSRRAEATGATKSALIRDAISEYLRGEDPSLPITRLRAALEDAAGVAPYLPDGANYVDEIRRADVARAAELDARRRS